MSHESKGELILFGIFIVFVVLVLVGICSVIMDIKKKRNTETSLNATICSVIAISSMLILHWYQS